MHVGNNIKKAMIDKGVSQHGLASLMGYSRQTINRFCSSQDLNTETIRLVACALNVSTASLLVD